MSPPMTSFRQRLVSRETLVGTFVKTPSRIICEVLGLAGLDTVCLDAEHAPFGRAELDGCVAALHAAQLPSLVRVAANSPEYILQALDCGATGVVIPHVTTPSQAEAAVKSTKFGESGRGYAGSTRAAGYTTRPMPEYLADTATETTVIVQVEDPVAVDAADDICAVEGVDCLFIGRNDLAVSLNATSPGDEVVIRAMEKVCRAGREGEKPIGMFLTDPGEAKQWMEQGATLFLSGSEHLFILQGASHLMVALKP